jgi:8-hydroxy-5-deazaflavin:NADPH oxidoreductase
MRIGVLGTGMVGHAIASKLVTLGHEVMMGSRTADNSKATRWAQQAGTGSRAGTFADTAAFGDVVFNCTQGTGSLDALTAAGARNLEGKVLVDVANELPPTAPQADSLGQRIQQAFPLAKVVKTLNTMNCDVMVNPQSLREPHTVFVSGNDTDAKEVVRELLESFGWRDVLDLGDISTARATERYLSLWLAMWSTLGTVRLNIKVVRGNHER